METVVPLTYFVVHYVDSLVWWSEGLQKNTAWWTWGVCLCVSISVWTQSQSEPLKCAGHFSVHNTGFPSLSPQLEEKKKALLPRYLDLWCYIWLTQAKACTLFPYSLYFSLGWKAYEVTRKSYWSWKCWLCRDFTSWWKCYFFIKMGKNRNW